MNLTSGTLLGGRLRYEQVADGYRTALEPVLLAASIPARPGELVLEAGCGAGAGLLCLAARVPDISGIGLERDAALADLAARNFAANGFAGLRAEAADVLTWQTNARFDHAFANPPWHDPDATASPSQSRRAAKQTQPGLLASWVATLARLLRPRGTLSLILPCSALPQALAALADANCGEATLIPLWPRENTPAKILIVRAKHLAKGPLRLLAGLLLHEGDQFTPQAEAILRAGKEF